MSQRRRGRVRPRASAMLEQPDRSIHTFRHRKTLVWKVAPPSEMSQVFPQSPETLQREVLSKSARAGKRFSQFAGFLSFCTLIS